MFSFEVNTVCYTYQLNLGKVNEGKYLDKIREPYLEIILTIVELGKWNKVCLELKQLFDSRKFAKTWFGVSQTMVIECNCYLQVNKEEPNWNCCENVSGSYLVKLPVSIWFILIKITWFYSV